MRLKRFDEAEADIRRGQALCPDATNLKIVKGMYLDETQPVRENIELDERRDAGQKTRARLDEDAADQPTRYRPEFVRLSLRVSLFP